MMKDSLEELNKLTNKIIGSAIEVHKNLGPGLFEHVYEGSLCYELGVRNMNYEKQKYIPVIYKNQIFDYGYRADIVVEGQIIIELKSVKEFDSMHEAQLLNYLKLSKLRIGLLINFNVPILKKGIKRVING